MANEFVARKGLIVLENGIKVTGSSLIYGDISASGNIVATKYYGNGTHLTDVTASYVEYDNVANKPALVSSSLQFNNLSDPFSGSFTGSFVGDGSQLTGIVTTFSITGSNGGQDAINLKTEGLIISGASNVTATVTDNVLTIGVVGLVSESVQIDVRQTTGIQTLATTGSNTFVGDQIISGSLITTADTMTFNGAMKISGSLKITGSVENIDGGFTGSFKGDGSGLTGLVTNLSITGSTGGQDAIDLKTEGLLFSASNNITATVSNNTVTIGVEGLISESIQVDVRNTTGIATIATTGSNTFTGIQHITNTTNSTGYVDGALIVDGGVGIGKDVNISGSLTVLGILSAVTMSTQYVTSSQVNIGTNKIILNDDDLVRFAGISVFDSGSTPASGSLYWDSLHNRWIYENESGSAYNSAVLIAGPKNTGSLGDEVGLTVGRITVAVGDDHIGDSQITDDGTTVAISGSLVVTGSVSASLFTGDGSGLVGINGGTLMLSGSEGGSSFFDLADQAILVSGSNGIAVTVNNQSLIVSGVNATTTTKGVASFNSTNFSVTGGEVTSNDITINGTNVTLGGTRNITLQEITTQGATTTDQVTFENGIVAATTLYTASITTGVAGPVTNQVVAMIPTSSYIAAHFDYVIHDGANFRTGTVMSIWNGANIQFTDTSTNDIGNTTGADFVVDTSLGNVRLKFSVPSGTWTIKTSAQLF